MLKRISEKTSRHKNIKTDDKITIEKSVIEIDISRETVNRDRLNQMSKASKDKIPLVTSKEVKNAGIPDISEIIRKINSAI